MKLEDIINELKTFNDWDGFNKIPIITYSVVNAINIIENISPDVVIKINNISLNPYETISIDWINKNDEISIEIGSNCFSYYVKFDNQNLIFVNNNIMSIDNINKFSNFVKKLYNPNN